MASRVQVKTTFEQYRAIEPFYTGGEITSDATGTFIASTVDEEDCLIVGMNSATPLCRIEGDGEAITSLALTHLAEHAIVCSRSLTMRTFQLNHSDGAVTAELTRTTKPHTTPVVASAVDVTGTVLATGGADGIVKVWDIRGGYCSHTFHGHSGVVTALHLFESNSSAKGAALGSGKKGTEQVNNSSASTLFLASASEDGRIKVHSLETRRQVASLDSHTTVVRALRFSPEQSLLLSASRDRTIVLWDNKTWSMRRVITAAEELEAAGFFASGNYLYAGGEQGRVRTWSVESGKELQTPESRGLESDGIVSILPVPGQYSILAVRNSQVLELLSYQSLEHRTQSGEDALVSTKTFSANHDEVIDMACVGTDLLAIADNTESVKILSSQTQDDFGDDLSFGSNVTSLEGHSDVVICMDVDANGRWVATGSKDNTARVWYREGVSRSFTCYATLAGHTASIGAIALPRFTSKAQRPPFLITGSEDKTIKRWDLSKLPADLLPKIPHPIAKAVFTRVAHEKDINAIDLSPIAPLFASASQDRTIKIWSTEDGSTTALLKGHKRGVWSIRFSPAGIPALNLAEGGSSGNKGLLVSGSGDNTVKIWSMHTYACLLTFEGHQNSVLKVIWLPPPLITEDEDGRQKQQNKPMIASASSDTLIKLWSPYASAESDHLLATLDGHTDRVWSLATPLSFQTEAKAGSMPPYSLISGAADAKINFWTDTTSTTATETSKALTERVEQDQLLQNHIMAKNYREVITLALTLNHPGRLLKVFDDVVNLPEADRDANTYMGVQAVDDVLASLNREQLYKLLERIRDWNTNVRTATIAQKVLSCLLRKYPQSLWTDMARDRNILRLARSTSRTKTAAGGNAMKDLFRALEAYTDRHYKRMEELIDESYLLEYTLREMDEIAGTTAITNGVKSTSEDVIMV